MAGVGKVITFEERKQIERLIKIGMKGRQIASTIGRHPTTLFTEIRRNGGIGNYTAEAAENNFWERKAKRSEHLSIRNKGQKIKYSCKSISERLDILEMQIEIVINKLRELTNEALQD